MQSDTLATIVHFTVPLSLTAALDTTKFCAEFAGRKGLSRAEIRSDRKKAALFHLENLPASARQSTFPISAPSSPKLKIVSLR